MPDGVPFRVREAEGSPKAGPAFLLIHGYGASSFTWRGLEPLLARHGRVLLADFVGFAEPHTPDNAYALPALAGHLLDVVLERDLDNLTVIGHSLGGGIALALALRLLREGSRLARLVIVSGAAYQQPLPPFVFIAHRGSMADLAFRIVDPALLAGQVLRTIVYDPACLTQERIDGYARPLADPSVRRALLATARVIVPAELDDLTAEYDTVCVPALLVWGRHDRVVPLWVGRRLADDLPQAELVVLERCGHLPMEERPRELEAAVVDFLERTSARLSRKPVSPRSPPTR
jgi:pimeloyl-ACP methyl ester carboxylesterase